MSNPGALRDASDLREVNIMLVSAGRGQTKLTGHQDQEWVQNEVALSNAWHGSDQSNCFAGPSAIITKRQRMREMRYEAMFTVPVSHHIYSPRSIGRYAIEANKRRFADDVKR